MRTLELWQDYSREDVANIFSPNGAFTVGTGTWGLQGIIRVPDRLHSYVFFVTFGRSQGDFDFDESVTDEGVLTWQSQPNQKLDSPIIQDLIGHDDLTDSIYLFLRTRSGRLYTYCGTLGYLVHDRERERPVHFQWQLLDWPPAPGTTERMELSLVPATGEGAAATSETPVQPVPAFTLVEVQPPTGTEPGAATTNTFKAKKRAFHPDRDARNRALGRAGEELVLEAERHRLTLAGRPDLAEEVVHVSVVEGDGAGYDVSSFSDAGETLHLEVKTTRNGASSAFFVSPNEVAFSEAHPDTFVLVRIFDFEPTTKSGRCYRVPGALTRSFSLTETEYRASLKPQP